jgi:hypothetical protein
MAHDNALSGFGERLLAVIDEGRRISTYKLALILAIMDVCAQYPGADGAAPAELDTIGVSRRVAEPLLAPGAGVPARHDDDPAPADHRLGFGDP